MTTIIISILCALGIGGGVMIASNSGGGGGSNSAVVGPVSPGGSGGGQVGGGGGSNTGGSNTGGSTGGNTGGSTGGGTTNPALSNAISMVNSTISFGGNNSSIKTGGILASAPASTILASRVSSASLQNGKITTQLNLFAPTLVSANTYRTNETYSPIGNNKFMSGYTPTNPSVSVTFDLTANPRTSYRADIFSVNPNISKVLPTLDFYYITSSGETKLGTFTNVNWSLTSAELLLGGRVAGLSNSDFGYIKWFAKFSHNDLDHRRGERLGTQTFYIFDAEKQLKTADYNRYINNTATFYGNIIGQEHSFASCGNNTKYYVFGNISLTLDFNSKTLSGSLSNTKYSLDAGEYTFGINPSFTGVIYNVSNNSTSPNFVINSISGNYTALNSDGTYGQGVIVKGSTLNKDEVVGDLSFAYSNGSKFVNFAFGAKKQ